jgi:hypothetical protein
MECELMKVIIEKGENFQQAKEITQKLFARKIVEKSKKVEAS